MSVSLIFCQLSEAARTVIAWKEEEELIGTIKFGRRRRDREEKSAQRGQNRWVEQPDWTVPGTCFIRPLSSENKTSFHFKMDPVRKLPTEAGDRAAARASGNPAAQYEAYISNEEKLERISAAIHATHIESQGGSGQLSRTLSPTAPLMSNIDLDPKIRREFWNRVYACARASHPNKIAAHRDRGATEWWGRVSLTNRVPEALRELALKVLTDRAKGALRKKRKRAPHPVYIDCDHVVADTLIAELATLPGWSEDTPAIRVSMARNAIVQYRLVAELSKDLDALGRLRVMAGLAQAFDALGLMYTIVIHEPDHHNDERNFHIHAAFYDKPCVYLPQFGKWDFELGPEERVAADDPRIERRATKVALNIGDTGGNYAEASGRFLRNLRSHFADLTNAELDRINAVGTAKTPLHRLDPRRYLSMGIVQEPTEHMGDMAAFEAVGVPTGIGLDNAEKIWIGAFAAARAAAQKRRATRNSLLEWAERAVSTPSTANPDGAHQSEVRQIIGEYRAVLARLGDDEEARDLVGIQWEMAKSRASKASDTCARLLEAVNEGTASPADRRLRPLIEARHASAEAHLDAVFATFNRFEVALNVRLDEMERDLENLASVEKTLRKALGHSAFRAGSVETESKGGASGIGSASVRTIQAAVPGHSKAPSEEQRWSGLRQHIHDARPFISVAAKRNILGYDVAGVSKRDLVLMRQPRYRRRAKAFLKVHFEKQGAEIDRVDQAIKAYGLGVVLPDSQDGAPDPSMEPVRRLYEHYHNHPRLEVYLPSPHAEEAVGQLSLANEKAAVAPVQADAETQTPDKGTIATEELAAPSVRSTAQTVEVRASDPIAPAIQPETIPVAPAPEKACDAEGADLALHEAAEAHHSTASDRPEEVLQARVDQETWAANGARDAIDNVLKQIETGDIPIHAPAADRPLFRVPDTTPDEHQLLTSERHAEWVQARLQGIAETQQLRMTAAVRMLRRHGHAGLQRMSADDAEARRALKWLVDYHAHPTLAGLIAQSALAPEAANRTTDRNPSAGASSSPFDQPESHGPAVAPAPELPASAPAAGDTRYQASLDWVSARREGIAAYANVVRTDPRVSLVIVDEVVRVDPKSIPEWATSVDVFEEEALIKLAIRARAAIERGRARSRLRKRIIDELERHGQRPIERIGDQWVTKKLSPDLMKAAHDWQRHPELAAAFARIDERWLAREMIAANRIPPQANPAANLHPATKARSHQIPIPSAGADLQADLSLEQQLEFQATRKGRAI